MAFLDCTRTDFAHQPVSILGGACKRQRETTKPRQQGYEVTANVHGLGRIVHAETSLTGLCVMITAISLSYESNVMHLQQATQLIYKISTVSGWIAGIGSG